jgi:uncharacterized protein with HEPN domain
MNVFISLKNRNIVPFVPWRNINDIRNKIIHHYFGVDCDIFWDTVISNIPNLKESIELVMKTERAR